MFDHLVVVHGAPGAGKTWLSSRLAPLLGYPLLSRDAIKEAMYDAIVKPDGIDDLAWSREVGAAAFRVFLDLIPSLGPKLVIDAHFQARFGANEDLRKLDPCATQVFVRAPAEVIVRRFRERMPSQHACHRPYPLPTVEQIEPYMQHFGVLDLDGPVLEIDTSEAVDVEDVARWVREHAHIDGEI